MPMFSAATPNGIVLLPACAFMVFMLIGPSFPARTGTL
jgi:hypothetical protein